MSASISKRKNNSWKDPEIEKVVDGYISRGSSKNSEFYTSDEVSDKLVEMGLPRIEPRELGAFLTADKYIKKHFYVLRYPNGNPDGRETDFNSRKINKWRVIFNDTPIKKRKEVPIKTVTISHYEDEYDWDAPPREPVPEGMWKTKDGSLIEMSKMTNAHLKNSINYCKRVDWSEMEKALIKERERRKNECKNKVQSISENSVKEREIELIKKYCEGYADGYVNFAAETAKPPKPEEEISYYKKCIMLDMFERLTKPKNKTI